MKHICSQCQKENSQTSMVKFSDQWVCPDCKSVFVQRIKEGVEGELVGVSGLYAFKPWVATYSLWLGILQLQLGDLPTVSESSIFHSRSEQPGGRRG